ncbi:hypothetical protein J6590_093699 [Homalodisca vitripennis]|nr:hypothetical protein J6590_054836 [Homalodisca vitripennis]KAG8260059.1 hypothetical protein J6590_105400 [Homalodisca vitripennis]KAG8289959.1 hypothetical protein J6590_093699 [Homalodisca vitripennis]
MGERGAAWELGSERGQAQIPGRSAELISFNKLARFSSFYLIRSTFRCSASLSAPEQMIGAVLFAVSLTDFRRAANCFCDFSMTPDMASGVVWHLRELAVS